MTHGERALLMLVPARSGSKGVPRKNLALLAGRPLISHTVAAARMAMRMFDQPSFRLVLSTDEEEIARVAREWGAEVPFLRPAELARDESPTYEVVLHALDALKSQEGYEPNAVILLQSTSPLATAEDICNALRLFWENADPVVSVTANEHPLEWSYYLQEDRLQPLTQDVAARRQEARATYRLNGAIYIASVEQLRKERSFLTPRMRPYVMPPERSIDIDSTFDLLVAETLLARKSSHSARASIEVAGRKIGPGQPCFIIAEAGVNHNGDIRLAKRLIDVAAEARADAVKFQTFKADRLASVGAPKAAYQRNLSDAGSSQRDMLSGLELSPAAHVELQGYCQERGLVFLSTPFDEESSELLDQMGVPLFKIGSGEITNLPFLRIIAKRGKPIILSTGMSYLSEVDAAVRAIREAGCEQLILLHCVSSYPANPADANLRAMKTLETVFGTPAGYSDHTLGLETALASVALGASVLEKHFTLDRSLPGPDHRASLEPQELAAMVRAVRIVESTLGHGRKEPTASEQDTAAAARKSLVAARDIPAGSKLTEESIAIKRPGTGLPPGMLPRLVGRTVRTQIPADTLITLEMLA